MAPSVLPTIAGMHAYGADGTAEHSDDEGVASSSGVALGVRNELDHAYEDELPLSRAELTRVVKREQQVALTSAIAKGKCIEEALLDEEDRDYMRG